MKLIIKLTLIIFMIKGNGLLVNLFAQAKKMSVCQNQKIKLLQSEEDTTNFTSIWRNEKNEIIANIYNPSIEIKAAQKIYLSRTYKKLPNLVVNGDFEKGFEGFTTEYKKYDPNDKCVDQFTFCESNFAITNNPQSIHSPMAQCKDLTNANGLMAMINGAIIKKNIWCQTLELEPTKKYKFKFSSTPGYQVNLPVFDISIDDKNYSFSLKKNNCVWEEFNTEFIAKQKQVKICIKNDDVSSVGNDFFIDNISLQEIKDGIDTFDISIFVPPAFEIKEIKGTDCGSANKLYVDTDAKNYFVEWYYNTSDTIKIDTFLSFDANKYTARLTNLDNTCIFEKSITTEIAVEKGTLIYPNVLKSNSESKDFKIFAKSNCQSKIVEEFKVFNRWGNLIYSANSIELPFLWQPTFNGDILSQGVYTFFLKYDSKYITDNFTYLH